MTDRETPTGAVEALAVAGLVFWKIGVGFLNEPAEGIAALTASGYSLTRSVDVERWQRIETAAQRHGLCDCPDYQQPYIKANGRHAPDCDVDPDLRDALGEG